MKFLFGVSISFVLFFLSCKGESDKDHTGNEKEAQDAIYNVKIVQKSLERKSFELYAREISFLNDTSFGENIKVVFYDISGDSSSVLFAKRGWYVEKTRNVGAFGNVEVFSVKGDSMFADTLFYIDSLKEIIVPSKVVIYRRGERIKGKSLRSDVNFNNIEIGGKVIGERRGSNTK